MGACHAFSPRALHPSIMLRRVRSQLVDPPGPPLLPRSNPHKILILNSKSGTIASALKIAASCGECGLKVGLRRATVDPWSSVVDFEY
jgi:hypothetical protein